MKHLLSSILSLYILVAALVLSPTKADNPLSSPYQYLKEKYDELPDNGKFATGAVAGFGVSRIAIKSATGVVKIAGAAFVASEALNAAGVFDDVPTYASEGAVDIKQKALSAANDIRNAVRRRLGPDGLKRLMKTDRMATMGAATGAFVGFIA